MNAYQEKLVRNSEKLPIKGVLLRLLGLCIFPVLLSYSYLVVENSVVHGWVDLWLIFHMLLCFLGGSYLLLVTLVCKGIFLFVDKVSPLIKGDGSYLHVVSDLEATKCLTKMRYDVNSLLLKFLKNGCLGKNEFLFGLDIISSFCLFSILVSVGYVWTGVFYIFSIGLAIFGSLYFRGMIYSNVYRLEDTLGGEENLDDLSDQLFNGGR